MTIDYANTGETDIPAPLIILTGQGLNFRMPGESTYSGNDLLLLGINPDGPLGLLPPGFRGEIQVPFLPTGVTAHFPYSYSAEVLGDPNQPFDWTRLGDLGLALPAGTTSTWANITAAAQAKIGNTWGDVVAAVDRALTVPVKSSGSTGLADVTADYDFLRLLRLDVMLAGSPAYGLASQPPSGGPQGPTVVESVPDVLTLYNVGPTLQPGQHTYLITPGLAGGDPDPSDYLTGQPRYLELAQSIVAAEPDANVLLLDWSPTAPRTVFIGGGGGLGGRRHRHRPHQPDGRRPVPDPGGPPGRGALRPGQCHVHRRELRQCAEQPGRRPTCSAAGAGRCSTPWRSTRRTRLLGYPLTDLGINFRNSYAFETCLIFDSHQKLGYARSVDLRRRRRGGGPTGLAAVPLSNFTILENFAKDDDSELGVVWLNSRLAAGDTIAGCRPRRTSASRSAPAMSGTAWSTSAGTTTPRR